jgi:DNA-directed RNA polymerase sigma subunit (sigma70/sigma32)
MAIQGSRCRCKTWNIGPRTRLVSARASRKILEMAARYQPHEAEDADGLEPDADDAAALRELVREARLNGPLTVGEVRLLLDRSALGDRPSQDRLVAAHLNMVIRLAMERGEQGLSLSDLVQEGSIGLVEAVRSFSVGSEIDFSDFAEEKVGAYMDAAIATEAAAARDAQLLVTAATDYERTEVTMRHDLHRQATVVELAEQLEWTVDRTRDVAQVVSDARRRHDEELVAFIDPDLVEVDVDVDEDEPAELDG